MGMLVVRAWPHDGPPRLTLEQIHRWLVETGPLGFIPVPVRGLDGRTLQEGAGRLWEVTPWMPGAADPEKFLSPSRINAGFAALAAFHQRLAHHAIPGTSPGLQARLRELEGLNGGGFALLERVLRQNEADPLSGLAMQWVDAARRGAPMLLDALRRAVGVVVERQPCLRDVRPDHFLFSDDRVTGLVDFGAMGFDTVAADLARLASEWPGRDQALRSLGFDAYNALRSISPRETALIDVFERSAALLGAGHWVRWHFLERRTFEDPLAVQRGLEKGLRRLTPFDPFNASRSGAAGPPPG